MLRVRSCALRKRKGGKLPRLRVVEWGHEPRASPLRHPVLLWLCLVVVDNSAYREASHAGAYRARVHRVSGEEVPQHFPADGDDPERVHRASGVIELQPGPREELYHAPNRCPMKPAAAPAPAPSTLAM